MTLRDNREPLTVVELASLLAELVAQGHGDLPIHGGYKLGREPVFALRRVVVGEANRLPLKYPELEPPATPYLSITHL